MTILGPRWLALVLFTVLTLLWAIPPAFATDAGVTVYVFSSDRCPHCQAQEPFLRALAEGDERVELEIFNIRTQAEHRELFRDMARRHGVEAGSVPSVFVGGAAWVGDSAQIRHRIEARIAACLESGCVDSRLASAAQAGRDEVSDGAAEMIDLPGFGRVDLSVQPLVVSTALIAFVDGFNPCSLWVLTILLALVIHSGSRRRILLVGLTYLATTALIYGLFISGVFGLLGFVTHAHWVHALVALLALVFAVVNIKDYFWFQRGLSFTIDERHKPGIFRRIRGLMDPGRSPRALIGATIIMAAGISFIELPCTAGFPVIWTGILAGHEVTTLAFVALLALYLLIYLGIELVIFLVALTTLRIDRFEERHGRILKLIGGLIMLALALVLLVRPALMQSITGTLGVFGFAVGAALLVLLAHRWLLPRFGITLGDEWNEDRR